MASRGDAHTEEIIKRAIAAEEGEKALRKQSKQREAQAAQRVKKGKTLEEIESEEGGPIKESLVGMAHTKRTLKRKGGDVDDTALVDDVEAVEEELQQAEEDGIMLEAFNLKEEREHGYFDDAGNYVEKETKESDEDDTWLKSEEAKVVSAETRRKIAEQQRRLAKAEAPGPLSATQVARLQLQGSQLMEPSETVARALKRLGGHSRVSAGKRAKRDTAAEAAAPDAKERAARFNELTETATALLDAGDNDIYSRTKEHLESAAAVYIDLPGPPAALTAGGGRTAYEDADEDMFASDDEAKGKGKAAAEPAAAAAAPTAPTAGPPAAAAAPAAPAVDYASWPVKELRRFLVERGQDVGSIVEKADLAARVAEAAAADAAANAGAAAPAGYAFDPGSGFFFSAESGMYWDPASKGFYSGGKWYNYDADKQEFVEWK